MRVCCLLLYDVGLEPPRLSPVIIDLVVADAHGIDVHVRSPALFIIAIVVVVDEIVVVDLDLHVDEIATGACLGYLIIGCPLSTFVVADIVAVGVPLQCRWLALMYSTLM